MLRSAGAIAAGFLYIGILSFGADGLVHALLPTGFDSAGRAGTEVLVASLVYVAVFAVSGCYLTARLAPDRPMRHALVLGLLGLAFNVAGTVAVWDTAPAWYHAVALLLVMPYAFLGGLLREREVRRAGTRVGAATAY